MGSFTETCLSFDFTTDTPEHVLAAFSALSSTEPLRDGAPALPAPVVEGWEWWEPDWREAGYPEGEGDPFADQPWKHDWSTWVSTSMGVVTTAHGLLRWSEIGRWNLDCRFSWKCLPDAVSTALQWLAPFIESDPAGVPTLVGYAKFEYAPRPHLFWVEGNRWLIEDLNTDDEWQ